MIDFDVWGEVLDTMRRNKLRSALTGFSVAWGIFMLIILLGSGQGLARGVEWQFRDDATNSIRVGGRQTSVPHLGLPAGRRINFTNNDLAEAAERIPFIERVSGRLRPQARSTVAYRNVTTGFDVMGVHPDHLYLEKTLVVAGRFLNDIDQREARKTAVIGTKVKKELFGTEDPLGKWFSIGGIAFEAVGVFDDVGGEGELERIYIPVSTAQRAFNSQDRLNMMLFLLDPAPTTDSKATAESLRSFLAARHRYDVKDPRAIWLFDNAEEFARYSGLISGIRIFVWVIGLGTILAGVVGVSNIMLITVRERTKEIGVRKALGATPASIIGLVLKESVLITSIAGLIGLLAGIGTVESISKWLPASEYFREPSVELSVAIQATLVLIFAGAVAGFIPARRAAAIRPIEALRDE